MKIAVTDGNTRAALAITRSLGKAGHQVIVGESASKSLAGASKYCLDTFSYPPPSSNVIESMKTLAEQTRQRDIDFLIPVADKTLLPIMEFSEQYFHDVRMPLPDYRTVLDATDKYRLFQLAQDCGVPIPRTVFVEKFSEGTVSGCADLPFSVVIKPARSLFRRDNSLIESSVLYASSPKEVQRLVDQNEHLNQERFLIQERVIGPGIGYFVFFVDNEIIAEFSHRRIREKPPSGGVSVYSESIPVREDIREYSLKLLKELNWSGVAMVEFKLDHRTGTPALMEINPRFWGSLQLAIDSGVDFPRLLVDCMCNGQTRLQAPPKYEHRRWRWLLGDFDNLLLRCLKSEEQLSLPPEYPARAQSILSFLKSFGERNLGFDVLKRDDPQPFLFEFRTYLKDLLS